MRLPLLSVVLAAAWIGLPASAEGTADADVLVASAAHETVEISASIDALTADDLEFLRNFVGNARMLGLGEPQHRRHEFLVLRNRMFQYLVEQLKFTAIAVETGFNGSITVDDYVLGASRELTNEIIAAAFSFTAPEALAANRDLIEWMRAYNSRAHTSRKLRFYGVDPMGGYADPAGRPGNPFAAQPLQAALDYLSAFAPHLAKTPQLMLRPYITKLASPHGFESLKAVDRDRFSAALADLCALFERVQPELTSRSGGLAYQRAYRNLLNARAIDGRFRLESLYGADEPYKRSSSHRDAVMAQNALWALQQEGPHGRVFLFAHNGHLRKAPATLPDGGRRLTSVGQQLVGMLGEELRVLGSIYAVDAAEFRQIAASRADTGALDGEGGILARVGGDFLALDLRRLRQSSSMTDSWNEPRRIWHNPFGADVARPLECFDALIFVRKVTSAELVP